MAKKPVAFIKVDPKKGVTYEQYVGICRAIGKEPESHEEFEKSTAEVIKLEEHEKPSEKEKSS